MAYTNTGQGLHRFTDPADGDDVRLRGDVPRRGAAASSPASTSPISRRRSRCGRPSIRRGRWPRNGAGDRRSRRDAGSSRRRSRSRRYFVTLVAGPYHLVHVRARRHPAGALRPGVARARTSTSRRRRSSRSRPACFDRYHELFGVRYPFGKYDQAFVPEFTHGRDGEPGLRDVPRRLRLHLGRHRRRARAARAS